MLSGLLTIKTDLGWLGIQAKSGRLVYTAVGNRTRRELLARFDSNCQVVDPDDHPRLVKRFLAYTSGKKVSLRDLKIDESWMTPFQRKVVKACRAVQWGETVSYGQLATVAGSPGASRAVGTVMSRNRFPLVVPCHRVCSSNGIGGFSAPNGVQLKRRLLENEGALNKQGSLQLSHS